MGVQYADSAETRRLGGFQGVEGILEYQRFCRGRPQRFRRQMVDHRLMLADAHLAGCENCFQAGQQAQPIQRGGHVRPRAGGSRRHGNAPFRQKCQQCCRAGLGRDLLSIVVLQHPGNAAADFRLALLKRVMRFQIGSPLLHAHGKEDLIQSRLRGDVQPPEIPGAQIFPDTHRVQQDAI